MRSLVFALLLVSCGGSSSKPAATVKSDAPPFTPKRAHPAKAGALFLVDYEALLPIACWDAKHARWASGEACYEVIGESGEVQLEDGKKAKTGGWRVPTPTDCTLGTPLLMFEGSAGPKPTTLALWPTSGDALPDARAKRVSWEATKKGALDLAEGDRARLASAMSKLTSGAMVSLVQVASADLDLDGKSELLFSATGGGFDPSTKKGIAALFLGVGASELLPIRTSDRAVFRVEAITDVDDDGVSEVLASERTFHDDGSRTDAFTLIHFETGVPTAIGPIETCWPPAKAK